MVWNKSISDTRNTNIGNYTTTTTAGILVYCSAFLQYCYWKQFLHSRLFNFQLLQWLYIEKSNCRIYVSILILLTKRTVEGHWGHGYLEFGNYKYICIFHIELSWGYGICKPNKQKRWKVAINTENTHRTCSKCQIWDIKESWVIRILKIDAGHSILLGTENSTTT